jgi:hypothetical protein
MNSTREQFAVDEKGNRLSVLLDIRDYEQLPEALGGLGPVHAYEWAEPSRSKAIPLDQAVDETAGKR